MRYRDSRFRETPETFINGATAFVTFVLAMVFLIGAVWTLGTLTLDKGSSWAVILAALTAFVVSFAILMALLLNAKPSDVFAVTAAYAAVLVVFAGLANKSLTDLYDELHIGPGGNNTSG